MIQDRTATDRRVIACIDTPEVFDTILIPPPREPDRSRHARTPHPFGGRLGPPRIRSLFPDPAHRGGPGRHAPRSPLPGLLAMHNAQAYTVVNPYRGCSEGPVFRSGPSPP